MTHLSLQEAAAIIRGRRVTPKQHAATGVRVLNARAVCEPEGAPIYARDAQGTAGTRLEPGDVVIALTGQPGLARIVDEPLAGSMLAADCAALRARPGGPVSAGWLGLWARSTDFRSQVTARSRVGGRGVHRISATDLEGLTVPLASPQHQMRSLLAIEEMDRACDSLRRLIEDLQALRSVEIDIAMAPEEP